MTYGQGLTNPRHLAFQPRTDYLYVVEDSTKEVWCFTQKEQQPYKRIAISGVTSPNGIAFSKAGGDLLVTDYTEGVVIRIVDCDGDEPPKQVIHGLKNPYGMVVDAEGQIIVADSGNEAIKIFSPALSRQ